jgi:beta-glucosidase
VHCQGEKSMSNTTLTFPSDFVWGVATSSYQIEGATGADGRGVSIWDTFCRTPGKVVNGDTGDVACDHFHRYPEDVDLMAQIGVNAYRFSIAWPRILPQGRGTVNQKGLDFYDRLVDSLLAKGIEPFATLYHWDLPQPLEDAGGWPYRSIVDAFVNYADVVSRRLSDRVHNWMTHNEPWCISFLSYAIGHHAPGRQDMAAAVRASHNVLLSHGLAVPVLRANGTEKTRVGIVLNFTWQDPASDSPEDQAAAWRLDGFNNRWFIEPVFKGQYPADMLEIFGQDTLGIQPGDMEKIATPIDFLALNYYTRSVVAHDPGGIYFQARSLEQEGEHTTMGWEVYPQGLYNFLTRFHTEYSPKAIYITENGASFDDVVAADGQVHDERRTAYLEAHFAAAHRAIQEGVPLKGYFVWSFMDNFEWAWGYTKRFGIVYVDYPTQKRILKDSGAWYSRVVRANGW